MRIHPGISLLAALATAAVLEAGVPASLDAPLLVRMVPGGVTLVAGALLLVWSIRTLRRHRTTIEPHQEPSAIVTSGPFRLSRNPMYVAALLMMSGFVFLSGSAWFLVATVLQFALLNFWIVPGEEATLKRAFPDVAASWFSSTRRWI